MDRCGPLWHESRLQVSIRNTTRLSRRVSGGIRLHLIWSSTPFVCASVIATQDCGEDDGYEAKPCRALTPVHCQVHRIAILETSAYIFSCRSPFLVCQIFKRAFSNHASAALFRFILKLPRRCKVRSKCRFRFFACHAVLPPHSGHLTRQPREVRILACSRPVGPSAPRSPPVLVSSACSASTLPLSEVCSMPDC